MKYIVFLFLAVLYIFVFCNALTYCEKDSFNNNKTQIMNPAAPDYPEIDAKYKGKSGEKELTFITQFPNEPGVYDAPATSTINCPNYPLNPRKIILKEPSSETNSNTGLLIVLGGIYYGNDCNPTLQVPDASWFDSKNIIIAQIFYRNITFFSPYDFGKYQIVDVLRGLGAILDEYPNIDNRRLYLYGGSGGGQLALQVIQASRHIWIECYIHSAITKITTHIDWVANYENDPYGDGWNCNLIFPYEQGTLSNEIWNRYQAERNLRSPQCSVLMDPVFSESVSDFIPQIWMMHGTADPSVDLQHILDYQNKLEYTVGTSADVLSSHQWQLGNWNFIHILNGNHSYGGAASDECTRALATNKYNPNAFTRVKNTVPDFSIDYKFPQQNGLYYHISGSNLMDINLSVEETLSSVKNWNKYY